MPECNSIPCSMKRSVNVQTILDFYGPNFGQSVAAVSPWSTTVYFLCKACCVNNNYSKTFLVRAAVRAVIYPLRDDVWIYVIQT